MKITLPTLLILLLANFSSFGQFKKLSSTLLKDIYSGDLVIIDKGYSQNLKESLSSIFSNYKSVTFSKEAPSGKKAVLEITPVKYYLPMGPTISNPTASNLAVNEGGLMCLQISKNNNDIIVPLPSMEYASEESMRSMVSEGHIILASRLIKSAIEWSMKSGKGYDFITYFKNNAKENKTALSGYKEAFIREEDVLFRKGKIPSTSLFTAELSDVSEKNPKMKTITTSELESKIKAEEKFAVSYLVETSNGTFKLMIDALSGSVLLSFKTETSSYWDGFNKPALKAVSKALGS